MTKTPHRIPQGGSVYFTLGIRGSVHDCLARQWETVAKDAAQTQHAGSRERDRRSQENCISDFCHCCDQIPEKIN